MNTGSFEVYAVNQGPPTTLEKRPGTLNQLHGMLGFIDKLDLENKKLATVTKSSGALSSKELMYQRFLIYANFFSAETPVVLCEGETDNVYLIHAIRSLAAEYPTLAAVLAGGKIQINVRLYKYRQSSTARILGLRDGGSGFLNRFIATYKKETGKFKAPGQKHPVIIVYDNDSGAGRFEVRLGKPRARL